VVREIAIRCLNHTGGYGVAQIFVNALSDESPSVRTAAIGGLQDRVDAETYTLLLQVYEKVPDPQHRQEIALMLGRSEGGSIDDLKRLDNREQVREARDGCLAALAKRGDHDSQAEFLNRLRNSKNYELKRFLEYVNYIGQIWALQGLAPILNDKTPLLGLGLCRPVEGYPTSLRACDIAVNLIAKIARTAFSFVVNRRTNYTETQLAEARRVLDSLP
jgi:hypothetical protein